MNDNKETMERGLESRKPIFSLVVVVMVLAVCVIGGTVWVLNLLEGFGALMRLHEPAE